MPSRCLQRLLFGYVFSHSADISRLYSLQVHVHVLYIHVHGTLHLLMYRCLPLVIALFTLSSTLSPLPRSLSPPSLSSQTFSPNLQPIGIQTLSWSSLLLLPISLIPDLKIFTSPLNTTRQFNHHNVHRQCCLMKKLLLILSHLSSH